MKYVHNKVKTIKTNKSGTEFKLDATYKVNTISIYIKMDVGIYICMYCLLYTSRCV